MVGTLLTLMVILGTLAMLALMFRRAGLDPFDFAAAWTEQAISSWLSAPPVQAPAPDMVVEEFDQLGSGFGRDERVGAWIVEPVPDEGVYRMLVWPGHLAWHVTDGPPVARAATQVRIDAAAAAGYAGLVAGYRDGQNFYVLAVDGLGNYRVQALRDGAWSELQPWTASALAAPAGAANTLAVDAMDGGLRFSANGSPLYELKATEPITGATGIVAGSDAAGGIERDTGMLKADFDWYEAEVMGNRGEAPAQ